MEIDGYIPADPKIAFEQGTTFTYDLPFGNLTIIAKMAGDDNAEFNQGFQKTTEKHIRESRLGTAKPDAQLRDYIRLYAETVVIRWTTTIKSAGKAIEPTQDNFVDLMTSKAMRRCWAVFQEDVSDLANFRAELETETAKN